MEKQVCREQPIPQQDGLGETLDYDNQKVKSSEDESVSLDDGEKKVSVSETSEGNGSLGKFKDTASLLNAYNNLQAEFTKKCQLLRQANKKLESLKFDEVPVYDSENWQDAVASFLNSHEEAKKYSAEISNEILLDPSIKTDKNALELAWGRVIGKHFKSPDDLSEDENFINEKILSKESVKNKILNEYFTKLQKNENPPLISSSGSVVSKTNFTPKTMKEAKLMVEQLFKLKGN